MCEVVCVSHRWIRGQNLCFGHFCDKQGMGAVVVGIDDLGRHECIDAFGYIIQSVGAAFCIRFEAGKLIRISAAGETKPLEGVEFCLL